MTASVGPGVGVGTEARSSERGPRRTAASIISIVADRPRPRQGAAPVVIASGRGDGAGPIVFPGSAAGIGAALAREPLRARLAGATRVPGVLRDRRAAR